MERNDSASTGPSWPSRFQNRARAIIAARGRGIAAAALVATPLAITSILSVSVIRVNGPGYIFEWVGFVPLLIGSAATVIYAWPWTKSVKSPAIVRPIVVLFALLVGVCFATLSAMCVLLSLLR